MRRLILTLGLLVSGELQVHRIRKPTRSLASLITRARCRHVDDTPNLFLQRTIAAEIADRVREDGTLRDGCFSLTLITTFSVQLVIDQANMLGWRVESYPAISSLRIEVLPRVGKMEKWKNKLFSRCLSLRELSNELSRRSHRRCFTFAYLFERNNSMTA